MNCKRPEEIIPTYLYYLFSGSLIWFYYQRGVLCFQKGVESIRKAFFRDQCNRAMIYIDDKIENAKERLEYKKETEKEIWHQIDSAEKTMQQIADIFQNLEYAGSGCLEKIANSFENELSGTKIGEQFKRYKYCLEGCYPNGIKFSDEVKTVIETKIKPQIETDLFSMCRFVCDYVDGMSYHDSAIDYKE